VRDVAIAGVAEGRLGDVGGTPVPELQAEAVHAALAECGLTASDVDGYAANAFGTFPTSLMCEYLGIRPTWLDTTSAGGSSFEMMVGHARDAIAVGRAEVVVVAYASNQKSARLRRIGGARQGDDPALEFEAPYASLRPSGMYALAAQRHMHEFGTTPEQLAEVAVAAREWALRNPAAYRHGAGPLTVDDVLASPMLTSPLHTLDCCLVTDGSGAVVVTSLERARDLAVAPVRVLGCGEHGTHGVGMAAMPDLTATGAAESSARAWREAGVGPADVDLAMLYDSFTITVLLTLEALGFCGRGEAGAFVEDGRCRPGGAFPMNTNGGGLSYCHPGQYGIFLLIEAARQLRGSVEPERQVPDCELAVCHGTGGILSTHSTVVLGVDR
jgi:acetyl-CoA acetyltransferase